MRKTIVSVKKKRKIKKLPNSNRAENKKKAKHQKEASIVFSGQSADNKERERKRNRQRQQAKQIRKKIGQQPEETVENKGKMGKKTLARVRVRVSFSSTARSKTENCSNKNT